MLNRLANVIYWIGCLCVIAAVVDLIFNRGPSGNGTVGIALGVMAFVICWTIRYILSGNKSFKP